MSVRYICSRFTVWLIPSLTDQACDTPNQKALKIKVEHALAELTIELTNKRPAGVEEYRQRLRAYLSSHPEFYGSAVALVNSNGVIVTCPYRFRSGDEYITTDLASPSYNIAEHDWFKVPFESGSNLCTSPYFDGGGGEIWMLTYSIPLKDENGVFAILTTDLPRQK